MRRQTLGFLWEIKWADDDLWYLDQGKSRYTSLLSCFLIKNGGIFGIQLIVYKFLLTVGKI